MPIHYLLTVTLLALCPNLLAADIYKDASQPVEARVEDLFSKLTLEEKIDMLGGVNGFDVRPIERLGVPKLHMSDGPAGTRNDGPTTAYPAPLALAASWDVELAKRFGTSIGRDARARGVHFLLGPAVNIHRVPQNGRNFEYLGEDPHLASRIVVPVIQGAQSQGVAATVKHFACNNQEIERDTVSVEVDPRTLQEIYLPAFKAAVTEAKVLSVMCAYNKINGVYCSANDMLQNEILKKTWGFTGVMMSDWGAVHETLGAVNGGLDLEMPNGKWINQKTVKPLLESGKVTQATIDDKVKRILRVAFTIGAFERPQKDESIPLDDPTSEATALQMAREGIVLLKNDNRALPLDRAKAKTIVVMGPNAHPAVTGGGGSSYTTPTRAVSVMEGLMKLAGSNVKVVHLPWTYESRLNELAKTATFMTNDGMPGLSAEYFANKELQGDPVLTRVDEHIDFNWTEASPGEALKKNDYSARWKGKIRVDIAGKYVFVLDSDDGSRLFIDDKPVIEMWSWRSNHRTVKQVELTAGEHSVRLEYFQGGKEATLSFGWGKIPAVLEESTLTQIKSADAVVLCVGFNHNSEGEGFDRSFSLPEPQNALITSVASMNPHTVLVLNAGGNVDMQPWLGKVPALLHAFYPGQAGGTAIAEILMGDVNPSGKLPVSFERRFEDNAAFGQVSYPGEAGTVNYTEGIFVGYRHFDKDQIAPQFCFGHGLSYTTFKYGNLKVSPVDGIAGASYEVSADITNTGDRAGAEVVQVYVQQFKCKDLRPVRELKSFARVELKPGETKQVKMVLDRNAFSYYSMSASAWVVDPGEFEIAVGSSSRELPLKQTIAIK